MPKLLTGTFSIKEILSFTQQSEFKTRFEYKDRDVIKHIRINEVKEFEPDRLDAPTIKYSITTRSYPQYKPYIGRDKKGRVVKYQRTTFHEYDLILEMATLSINDKRWSGRIGSNKALKKDKGVPWNQIAQIPGYVQRRMWNRLIKIKKYRTNRKLAEQKFKEQIEHHRKNAKYISWGDWVAKILFVNLDFFFTSSVVWKLNGHLFGPDTTNHQFPQIKNPRGIVFFPKHMLRLIEYLLFKGILKDIPVDISPE